MQASKSIPLTKKEALEQIHSDFAAEREYQAKQYPTAIKAPKDWLPILVEEVGEVAEAINKVQGIVYTGELVQIGAIVENMILDTLNITDRESDDRDSD